MEQREKIQGLEKTKKVKRDKETYVFAFSQHVTNVQEDTSFLLLPLYIINKQDNSFL